MRPTVTESSAKRAVDVAIRNYHWLLAAFAVVAVVAHYIPAVCLATMNADNTQVPLMIHDVFVLGHSIRDWGWGGHSDFFPDILLAIPLNLILRDGMRAIEGSFCLLLAGYLVVLTVLYRNNGGRNSVTFTAMLFLFFVIAQINFGIDHGLHFYHSLAFTYHNGTGITALACLALCQYSAVNGCGKSFWLIPALCLVTGLSDDSFQVVFAVPALATLVVARLAYPGRVRLFLPLFAGILIPSLTAHLLAVRLSPFQIDPGPNIHFLRDHASRSLDVFVQMLSPSVGGDFILFIAMDLMLVLLAGWISVSTFFKPVAKRIPLRLFILLVFGACLVGSNWGAALLTGNFGLNGDRYIRLAITFPVFLLLGYINHIIPWSRATGKGMIAAVSLAASWCALVCAPLTPKPTWQEVEELVPLVRDIMQKEHIEAGLADYWYANPIALLSGNTLPVRSALSDGSLLHWLNTTAWYAGSGTSDPPPEFRLIVMAHMDPDQIRRHYGEPERIVPAPPGAGIWIYSRDKAITYKPVFGALTNQPPDEFITDGDMLPSRTGTREGNSRVARAGRDRPDFLTYGPWPYLHPAAGHYRLTITYAWLAAPDPKKLARYDVAYPSTSPPVKLVEGRIPYNDTARHELTLEITIPDDRRRMFEVHTEYYGSGDISIDALKIVYLGK